MGPTDGVTTVTARMLRQLDPDAYIATSGSGATLAKLRSQAGTKSLRAVTSGRVFTVDADAARVLTATVSPVEETPATRIQAWSTDNGGATWTKEGSFVDYATQYEPAGNLDFVDRNHGCDLHVPAFGRSRTQWQL